MRVRNAFRVLAGIIDYYPMYASSAKVLDDPVKKIAEDNSRNDLKVLAERYLLSLSGQG